LFLSLFSDCISSNKNSPPKSGLFFTKTILLLFDCSLRLAPSLTGLPQLHRSFVPPLL
jgi:hypothetical protein